MTPRVPWGPWRMNARYLVTLALMPAVAVYVALRGTFDPRWRR